MAADRLRRCSRRPIRWASRPLADGAGVAALHRRQGGGHAVDRSSPVVPGQPGRPADARKRARRRSDGRDRLHRRHDREPRRPGCGRRRFRCFDGADILARAPGLADRRRRGHRLGHGTGLATGHFDQMLAIARMVAEQSTGPRSTAWWSFRAPTRSRRPASPTTCCVPTDKPMVVTGAMRNSAAPTTTVRAICATPSPARAPPSWPVRAWSWCSAAR